MAVDQTARMVGRRVDNMADVLRSTLRDLFDEIFSNDAKAYEFLGGSRIYFEENYKPFCGVKQGNAMTYRKSDLLERREQLRLESEGRHVGDA